MKATLEKVTTILDTIELDEGDSIRAYEDGQRVVLEGAGASGYREIQVGKLMYGYGNVIWKAADGWKYLVSVNHETGNYAGPADEVCPAETEDQAKEIARQLARDLGLTPDHGQAVMVGRPKRLPHWCAWDGTEGVGGFVPSIRLGDEATEGWGA